MDFAVKLGKVFFEFGQHIAELFIVWSVFKEGFESARKYAEWRYDQKVNGKEAKSGKGVRGNTAPEAELKKYRKVKTALKVAIPIKAVPVKVATPTKRTPKVKTES